MKIEILNETVSEQSGTSAKSGKPYSIRKQAAYVYLPDADGQICKARIELQLDRQDTPYKVGQYQLSDSSFKVGDFGALLIGRVHLSPVLAAAVKAA